MGCPGQKVHEEVVKDIITFSLKEGLKIRGLDFSPIKARKATSNTLFICQKRGQYKRRRTFELVNKVIDDSHTELSRKKFYSN